MPKSHPRIGEAVAAAMRHNSRLAHDGKAASPDTPLQVRHLPHPSADPHSVPGMIVRLTETATPDEVAEIIEEVNSALVGALPQLTELVAVAADWTRVRLSFDGPDHNPTFETWTLLAAVHVMLREAQEALESAVDGIAARPATHAGPRHHERVNVLRTRQLLNDVLGAEAVREPEPASQRSPEGGR
ncbi:hypothetical protein OG285_05735 [Streptomyces sp. NBC_01471]|uniref:hypothetical protein n=1 Tax=Streptomyces sp. NBC_01471 TaxID=2903879 RepID=UPI0032536E04